MIKYQVPKEVAKPSAPPLPALAYHNRVGCIQPITTQEGYTAYLATMGFRVGDFVCYSTPGKITSLYMIYYVGHIFQDINNAKQLHNNHRAAYTIVAAQPGTIAGPRTAALDDMRLLTKDEINEFLIPQRDPVQGHLKRVLEVNGIPYEESLPWGR